MKNFKAIAVHRQELERHLPLPDAERESQARCR